MKRIWTHGPGGGTPRELARIGKHKHGDYLLTMDDGEVWQFSARSPVGRLPRVEQVKQIEYFADGKPKKPTNEAIWMLENPERTIIGTLRIIPPAQEPRGRAVEKSLPLAARKETQQPGKLGRKTLETKRWDETIAKMDKLVGRGMTQREASEELEYTEGTGRKASTIKRRYATWLRIRLRRKDT